MTSNLIISPDERSPTLRQYVFTVCTEIVRVIKCERSLLRPQGQLLYLLSPWLFTEPNIRSANSSEFGRIERALASLGFDGKKFSIELTEILESDAQLRHACGNHDLLLAQLLDQYVITGVLLGLISRDASKSENAWCEFERLVYETGRVTRLAYTHLFNFSASSDDFYIDEIHIQRLHPNDVAAIVGGSELRPLFHRGKGGDFFVVAEDRGPCDTADEWILERHLAAGRFCQVLQYFKDGVVHATYTVPFFLPIWVNSLWKMSAQFVGSARLNSYREGAAPYTLNDAEVDDVRVWWKCLTAPDVQARMADKNNGFRQMLFRAGEYYEGSIQKERGPERLVDLAIALESMFTPASAKTELTFRIAQGAAQLVGTIAEERIAIAKSMKRLYDRRSGLFHGQYDVKKYAAGEYVTDEELESWASVIRRALLRMFVVYLRGSNDKERFLGELYNAALDGKRAEQLRAQSDVVAFLAERR